MSITSFSPDRRSLLAKGCSALARAGQMLSVVTDPAKGRASLKQVASLVVADRDLAHVIATDEIAQKCRSAAETTEDPQVLTVCRQIATGLARTASSLAKEIQQLPAAALQPQAPSGTPAAVTARPQPSPPTPEAKPAPAPVPAPEPVSAPTPAPQSLPKPEPEPAIRAEVHSPPEAPQAKPLTPSPTPPRPAPIPKPKPEPQPARPSTPRPAPARTPEQPRAVAVPIDRVSIARTVQEKEAVTRALHEGKRFAPIANDTFIDTRTNRMWTAHASPPGKHTNAQAYARDCRAGQHSDWRLPTPEELRALVTDGGAQWLSSNMGTTGPSGAAPEMLWSSETSSRFLGLFKQVTACRVQDGAAVTVKPGAAGIQALPVRS